MRQRQIQVPKNLPFCKLTLAQVQCKKAEFAKRHFLLAFVGQAPRLANFIGAGAPKTPLKSQNPSSKKVFPRKTAFCKFKPASTIKLAATVKREFQKKMLFCKFKQNLNKIQKREFQKKSAFCKFKPAKTALLGRNRFSQAF